jgi:drug/metabolite transporter (DMT)-like permease
MPPRSLSDRLWSTPILLLSLTAMIWGGNAVAGRLAVGQVSPMVLTTGRWVVACSVLALIARADIRRSLPALLPRWRYVIWMGTLGFTAFNALFYEAAHRTSAVNMTILQGAIPVFVLLGALVAFRLRITPLQAIGMAVTVLGVVVLASQGEWHHLMSLTFNIGDLWMLVAGAFYALYTLGLRSRPAVPGLAFFSVMAATAALTSLPLLAVEVLRGDALWPTARGWLIILYVGLFPSLVSQLLYMRGVDLIGPGRAGLFVNLVPVFGALLAVVLLGEPFGWSSAASLVLVLGGIFIAEWRGRR